MFNSGGIGIHQVKPADGPVDRFAQKRPRPFDNPLHPWMRTTADRCGYAVDVQNQPVFRRLAVQHARGKKPRRQSLRRGVDDAHLTAERA